MITRRNNQTRPWAQPFGKGLLALLLFGVPLSVGCGDQSGEPPGPVIKLGLFTRADRDFNDEANITLVLMALREINEAGGISIGDVDYGLDLVTSTFEDPTSATAAKTFEELAAAGVAGVLGPPWSSQLLGSSQEQDGVWRNARKHKLVTISESASSSEVSELDDDGYVFRMVPPDSLQAQVGAEEVWNSGYTKVALLLRNDSYATGLAAEFTAAFEALGGEITAEVSYDATGEVVADLAAYSFDGELDAVFAGAPDVVYFAAFDEIVQIAQRIVERDDINEHPAGDVAFFGADSLYEPATLESVPSEVITRLRGSAAGADRTSQDYQQFVAALEDEGLESPWSAAAELYDAVYIFALAMQAAGSADPVIYKDFISPVSRNDEGDTVVYLDDFARAKEALLQGRDVNYEGVSGPIELDERGDPSSGSYLIWQAQVSAEGRITFETEKIIPF